MTLSYYFRQLIFASLFFVFAYIVQKQYMTLMLLVFFTINTLLYPFSRYLYDLIIDFIIGDSVYILPALIDLIYQIFILFILFFLSWLIAPVSILIILIRNKKAS